MIGSGHKLWKREELRLDINTVIYCVVGQKAEVVEVLLMLLLFHLEQLILLLVPRLLHVSP